MENNRIFVKTLFFNEKCQNLTIFYVPEGSHYKNIRKVIINASDYDISGLLRDYLEYDAFDNEIIDLEHYQRSESTLKLIEKLSSDDEDIETLSEIHKQVSHAAYNSSLDYIEEFIEKTKKLKNKDDIVEFIKHNNLPIIKGGKFLAYKFLHEYEEGRYVDDFTKKIKQDVGYVVEMPRTRVDPSKGVGCSSGLHVGNFDYLTNRVTDKVVFFVVVDPKDVVVVPEEDCGKVRVCRYHIVKKLDDESMDSIRSHTTKNFSESDREFLNEIYHFKIPEPKYVVDAITFEKRKIESKAKNNIKPKVKNKDVKEISTFVNEKRPNVGIQHETKVIRKVRSLRKKGLSLAKIQQEVGISERQVRKILGKV